MITAETQDVAVLADQEGNLYAVPRRVVERGRVPEGHKRLVLRRLKIWTLPQTIRPVRMLGWISADLPSAQPPRA